MVDAESVDEPLLEPAADLDVGALEPCPVLDPDPGERVDREEAAVVELGVRGPPADEPIVLPGVDGLCVGAGPSGPGCDREPVVVVVQLAADQAEVRDPPAPV